MIPIIETVQALLSLVSFCLEYAILFFVAEFENKTFSPEYLSNQLNWLKASCKISWICMAILSAIMYEQYWINILLLLLEILIFWFASPTKTGKFTSDQNLILKHKNLVKLRHGLLAIVYFLLFAWNFYLFLVPTVLCKYFTNYDPLRNWKIHIHGKSNYDDL